MTSATTATRTDTPLMETPFSVQVVPQQVLQDQLANTLERALQNVPGVVPFLTNQGPSDGFIIRGFGSSTTYRGRSPIPPTSLGGGLQGVDGQHRARRGCSGPGFDPVRRTEPAA